MLACVTVKFKEHPQPDSQGAQKGDVISIRPADRPLPSSSEMDCFMYFFVDLDIPCDFRFGHKPQCNKCPNAEPELCDFIFFKRGLWDDGDILDPPVLLKKCRYNIDFEAQLSPQSLALVTKDNKTLADRELLFQQAGNNPWLKSIITDKETLK